MEGSMLDQFATQGDLKKSPPEIAVIGIGAIEQHGRHLPISTDWVQVRAISRGVAEALNALLLPAIPFSMSECHGPMPGVLSLKPETLSEVVVDIARSIREQGIPTLLILNGHGGNFILEPTIAELNREYPAFKIIMPPEVWAPAEGGSAIFETFGQGIHAEEMETSMQLFLNPERVRDFRDDHLPQIGREFLDYTTMSVINPMGIWGVPSLGDPKKGEKAIQASIKSILEFVRKAQEVLS
jgi:creatinine amidohydrolase